MRARAKLRAERRTGTGKGVARRLRRDGYVPGVVYGHGEEPAHLKVRAEELETLLGRISVDNTLVDLQLDGESRPVLIREVQQHPFRPQLLHVDFFQIRADEKVRVAVPLHLKGEAPGVEQGGILQQQKYEIEVECLPDEIPSHFEVDVGGLGIGDSLHVGDLTVGGVTILEELDATLCVVLPPTVMKAAEEEAEEVAVAEEEGEEPELIRPVREAAPPEEVETGPEAREEGGTSGQPGEPS